MSARRDPPVEVAPDEARCTATTWRGMSHRPYGPGGYNRCARVTGHRGDHIDTWGNVRSDAWVRRHEDAATRSMTGLGEASSEAARGADAQADASRDDVTDAFVKHMVAPVGAAMAEQLQASLRAAGFDVTVTYEGGVTTIRDWPADGSGRGPTKERSSGA